MVLWFLGVSKDHAHCAAFLRNLTCNDLEEVEKFVPVHRSQGIVRGAEQLHDAEDDIISHQCATAGLRIMMRPPWKNRIRPPRKNWIQSLKYNLDPDLISAYQN